MAITLYDAVVPSQLQLLRALDRVLGRADAFAAARGITEAALIDARLAPDMLPLGYQVKSCAVHSAGAIAGVRAGTFSPDMNRWPSDLAGLRAMVTETIATLEAIEPAELEALADAPAAFRAGETVLPFTGAQFLLSFSQPNFYFHATAAYAILRNLGMDLGKRDYMGRPRFVA